CAFPFCDVVGAGRGFAALCNDRIDGVVCGAHVGGAVEGGAEIIDDDGRALSCEGERLAPADATPGTGHDGHLAIEASVGGAHSGPTVAVSDTRVRCHQRMRYSASVARAARPPEAAKSGRQRWSRRRSRREGGQLDLHARLRCARMSVMDETLATQDA